MIDLNKLTYREKPFSQVKQYTVHPLSDKGFNEYISKDSFARKYLNKIDPRILKELEEEEERELELHHYNIENERHLNLNDIETKNGYIKIFIQ